MSSVKQLKHDIKQHAYLLHTSITGDSNNLVTITKKDVTNLLRDKPDTEETGLRYVPASENGGRAAVLPDPNPEVPVGKHHTFPTSDGEAGEGTGASDEPPKTGKGTKVKAAAKKAAKK